MQNYSGFAQLFTHCFAFISLEWLNGHTHTNTNTHTHFGQSLIGRFCLHKSTNIFIGLLNAIYLVSFTMFPFFLCILRLIGISAYMSHKFLEVRWHLNYAQLKTKHTKKKNESVSEKERAREKVEKRAFLNLNPSTFGKDAHNFCWNEFVIISRMAGNRIKRFYFERTF